MELSVTAIILLVAVFRPRLAVALLLAWFVVAVVITPDAKRKDNTEVLR